MYKYVFGPVPSRRLGKSLGIDLIPYKTCSYDCIYCECGSTTCHTLKRSEYIPSETVKEEITAWFSKNKKPDWITFAGSGEPTLHSGIGEIISFIKKNIPDIPIAVLTNGSTLTNPAVRRELLKADRVIPSLDAATQGVFEPLNRPVSGISITACIDALVEFRKEYTNELWLETFLLPGCNDTPEELSALAAAFKRIKPDRIQLNTLDRPGTIPGLKPMQTVRMEKIREEWGIPEVTIIEPAAARRNTEAYNGDIESAILATIERRPCTVQDLVAALSTHMNEINKYLGKLEADGRITGGVEQRGVFYRIKRP